jgi:hypothetical protein
VSIVYPPGPEEDALMPTNPSIHTFDPKTAQAVAPMPCASRRLVVRRFDVAVALAGRRVR